MSSHRHFDPRKRLDLQVLGSDININTRRPVMRVVRPIECQMELQLVELHFQTSPTVDYAAIKRRAERILGVEIDTPSPEDAKDAYLLFHKNYFVTHSNGKAPAQNAILAAHSRSI